MKTLLAICPMLTCDDTATQAEQRRQNRNEDPRVDAVEEHLKDAVKGDQSGRVLVIAAGQFVPDDHHRDAARQPDHDQADHVLRDSRAEK